MMKLHLEWKDDVLKGPDNPWRQDYQSFCHAYPTFPVLLEAALQELPGTTATAISDA